MDNETEDKLLTRQEVADLLNVHLNTLLKMERSGDFLPARRLGKRRRYLRSEVMEFMRGLDTVEPGGDDATTH